MVENVTLIPRDVEVLDVASGRGRNALFLADHGWRVRAIDRDADALSALAAAHPNIRTDVVDLEAGSPSLGHQQYGGIIVFNYLHRPLMPAIIDALRPGGVLIYETFTVGQAQRGHPRNPAFLLGDGELASLVQPLRVLRAREGDFEGQLVASIVAMR